MGKLEKVLKTDYFGVYNLARGMTVGSISGWNWNNLHCAQLDEHLGGEMIGVCSSIPAGDAKQVTITLDRPITDFECVLILINASSTTSKNWMPVCIPTTMWSIFNVSNKIALKGGSSYVGTAYFNDIKHMTFGTIGYTGAAYVFGVNL